MGEGHKPSEGIQQGSGMSGIETKVFHQREGSVVRTRGGCRVGVTPSPLINVSTIEIEYLIRTISNRPRLRQTSSANQRSVVRNASSRGQYPYKISCRPLVFLVKPCQYFSRCIIKLPRQADPRPPSQPVFLLNSGSVEVPRQGAYGFLRRPNSLPWHGQKDGPPTSA